jgi:esterase/lipase
MAAGGENSFARDGSRFREMLTQRQSEMNAIIQTLPELSKKAEAMYKQAQENLRASKEKEEQQWQENLAKIRALPKEEAIEAADMKISAIRTGQASYRAMVNSEDADKLKRVEKIQFFSNSKKL